MAKNNLTKFLTGIAVIGAGVALGLAMYNKFDHIKRELDDEEFEDDDFFDDDYDDDEESSYVVINADVTSEDADEACEECEIDAEDAVEASVEDDAE